jgi:hypothetical protein
MKGSGGILVIGVAVFLIAAGITGRLSDVWNALRGASDKLDPTEDKGATCSTNNDCGNNETCQNGKCVRAPANPPCEKDSDCPTGTKCNNGTCRDESGCSAGQRHIKIDHSGQELCYPQSCIGSCDRGKCPSGYDNGILIETGSRTCICVRKLCQAAGHGSYNVSLLPTGFTSVRRAPNV